MRVPCGIVPVADAVIKAHHMKGDTMMKKKANVDTKIDAILGALRSKERKVGGRASGLAVRALATEDLASVAGGMSRDPYGGTETIQQGLSCDTKNDEILTA
jgi:hypothetical protein